MILEGVGSLRREFREFVSLGIFVNAPRDVCIERGVTRDFGMDSEPKVRELWETAFEHETKYFARDDPHGYADIGVDGTAPFDTQLDLGTHA